MQGAEGVSQETAAAAANAAAAAAAAAVLGSPPGGLPHSSSRTQVHNDCTIKLLVSMSCLSILFYIALQQLTSVLW